MGELFLAIGLQALFQISAEAAIAARHILSRKEFMRAVLHVKVDPVTFVRCMRYQIDPLSATRPASEVRNGIH